MKLFNCFLVSSLLGVHFCQAQIPFKIKAGAARSSLRDEAEYLNKHWVITWYGGIATTLRMGRRSIFQPELLYSERGFDYKAWTSAGNRKGSRRYGYISMPLLVGWHPLKKMSLLIGAEPGYMIWDYSKDELITSTYVGVDRHFNVDFDLGLSYHLLPRWTVEARALAGLIGLYDKWGSTRATNYPTGEHEGYHFLVQLGLSYDLKAN